MHFCSGAHKGQDCRHFRSLRARCKQLNTCRICYACLKPDHFAADSNSSKAGCPNCKRAGYPLPLRVSYTVKNNYEPSSQPSTSNDSSYRISNNKRRCNFENHPPVDKSMLLETFSSYIKVRKDKHIFIRGVIDSCSQLFYITSDLAKWIGGRIKNRTKLNLC